MALLLVALLVALTAPLAGAALAVATRDTRRAVRLGTAAPAVAFAAALVLVAASGLDPSAGAAIDWLDASVDRTSALLIAVVMATATVVAGFSSRSLDDDGRTRRYFALIGIVASGSALVVVPAAPVLLVVGWLASGWALVELVGFASPWAPARRAQRRIRLTLLTGDVALVAAVTLATALSDGLLTGNAPAAVEDLRSRSLVGLPAVHVVMLLVVAAGASRSALVPFHRWLVGTLTAPTPVSALVHAGVVSGAGLLLLRFAAPFVASGPAVVAAFGLGLATLALASAAMLVRSDVKGTLAWSTVAQMAFMVVQCSVGAFSSAVFHIAGHGMYKAALFLGAGDTVAAGLRDRRRPPGLYRLGRPARLLASAAIATASVALVTAAVRPDVSPAGRVLIVVFGWLTVACALHGWLRRAPFPPAASVAAGALGSLLSTLVYIGGLRLAEWYLKPSLRDVPSATVIGPWMLLAALGLLAGSAAIVAALPGAPGAALRSRARHLVVGLSDPRPPAPRWPIVPDRAGPQPFAVRPASATRRAEIRADVARAAAVVAPQWPLASFIAVNPLGGLESEGFDNAAALARRWRGARTHQRLEDYRRDHDRGLTRLADLAHVAFYRFTDRCERGPLAIDGQLLYPHDVIVADLLHGPESEAPAKPPTAVQRRELPAADELIDDVVSSWLAAYIHPPRWRAHHPGEGFVAMSRRLMVDDPRLRRVLSGPARHWVRSLDDDPAAVIDASLAVSGVADDRRGDELRSHLCQLPGWAGLARWRSEWAQPTEPTAALAPLDIVAVRALLEAAVIGSTASHVDPGADPPPSSRPLEQPDVADADLDARVAAVAAVLAPAGTERDRAAIRAVLAEVPGASRASMWLEAQERAFDTRLLSLLDRLDPGKRVERPEAQIVFCIDVRSEGLRRRVEASGAVETIGFAGFFGVPMRVRKLGWDHHEPRCPVLVSPAIGASEQARHQAIELTARAVTRQRAAAAGQAAHSGAKYGPGSPFALAEGAGWLLGPHAARRTFLPGPAAEPAIPPTRMTLDDDEVLLDQRVFFAESVLRTMGLTDWFAPLVVLCGHTSRTTNNAHGTALECGACGGAAGDDNARAVAALLNSPDIRHGLRERGIAIPDDTWFTAAVHDTASDRVTLLDTVDVPAGHHAVLDRVDGVLKEAGALNATARAVHLPGPAARVRERGADWAQVRPEWGLARNAAFVIGPRSVTAGLDLEGRAFLHSYEADDDPTGRVLETIMTAPLIVGHWISAQYYFSTVDPEIFGAGDKLLHNPIGTVGVIAGDRGDLRVGLPLQSTHLNGRPFHQPVRMLAVIQADLVRIEAIIANNPILRTLTSGSWLRMAARSHPHERWSTRTASGTWIQTPRLFDLDPVLTPRKEDA
ncbi:MAG: Na-translocating system protein MpsB [Acidimicrobiia bacterium]|nr:Na-translocating system protein MpsB [Acidimicrobiia bacterium]